MMSEPDAMHTLYVLQQGCYLSLRQESVLVKQSQTVLQQMQLPLLEQILVFGQSQVTTQLIRSCLGRGIPIAYLSRMGRCYGRLLPLERGYRSLARQQQQLSQAQRLEMARRIVYTKLKNSRVVLQRQRRRHQGLEVEGVLRGLSYLMQRSQVAGSIEQLMGFEGAGAAAYFPALSRCLQRSEFVFPGRSRRPPLDPVNAMLSFGYQVLWNHLLSLIELQGLDAYEACLHMGSESHAALASDLIEEFRAPLIDSLVLMLVNRGMVQVERDFDFPEGACYLNQSGRQIFLQAFLQRMEEPIQVGGEEPPRWDLLNRQVKAYKQFVLDPSVGYKPYVIR